MNPPRLDRDVVTFRAQGPRGLEAWLELHGGGASPELDALCRQRDAHTARLYWFTELPAAIAEARRTGQPILSLRLLGNLDEELSCANSRFFRRLLYPHPAINALLRGGFVLHWQSVRPVPVVTLDFGDGRRMVRPLTGNSVHLVLDPSGRAVDALPGLMRPEVFHNALTQARSIALADRSRRASMHAHLRMPPPRSATPSRAVAASAIAVSKHMGELPLLRAVTPPLDADTEQNLALHQRIHEAFAAATEWNGLDGLVEWIYADLFAMPLDDPYLGLDAPDPLAPPTGAPHPYPQPLGRWPS